MNIASISVKNILHRPLSSFLSVLLLAFGVGIISLLMSTSDQLERQFTKNIKGIDMVVGAKGSPLQLILSSVYHIDAPTGNIPLEEFEKLAKNPLVKQAIPLAYGDNYKGYRIVGTSLNYPKHFEANLKLGQWWSGSGEVVMGSRVAELTGSRVGSTFSGSHGLINDMDQHDHFAYTVVGVLQPTGTVVDKLILTDVSSVWDVHDEHGGDHHDEQEEHHSHEGEEHHEHDHDHESETDSEHVHHEDEEREITAGIVSFRSPMGNLSIPRMVNQNTSMQAALPAIEINRLFSLMATGIKTLRTLAILIVLISAISVFVSLYQSLKERKFELALLRSMGASGAQVFGIILLEGLIIAVVGYILGLVMSKLATLVLSGMAEEAYQYDFQIVLMSTQEALLLPAAIGIGFVAALIPAIRAYRLNISKVLSDA